ncbi:hypothetical protein DLM45_13245 [Hyphomicrobium methylovorum]|nr:hypothetical protein [Hyphomicrobium methylovorum]
MASHTNHPARLAAQAVGLKQWHGPHCPIHPDAFRFVSTGACIDCGRINSRDAARRRAAVPAVVAQREARQAAIAGRKAAEAERRALPNIANDPRRLAAIAAGLSTWLGPDCRHRHGSLRYTSSTAACVECRRLSNQRNVYAR